ncbi:MAG TPA: trypsin-like peptidase domain-containing protein [Gammaproteobacteria bacterium]
MAAHGKAIWYAAQCVMAGLAIAFAVVMVRPELVNLHRGPLPATSGYAAAVAATSPAVVNIYTERRFVDVLADRMYSDHGLGSGVVIDPRGYIVTAWHVIEGATDVRVQLADGRVATPRFVGADRATELALLKIDLDDLPTVKLGRSDSLAVGDVVLAIGNSLGLSHTVTLGIVSAIGRSLGLAEYEDFIQTDAAINAGNSGGALINTRGELVGINAAVTERSGGTPPEGIGFAIPVDLVRGVTEQLIAHGRVIRGYLGIVQYDPLPAALANAYGIDGWAIRVTDVTGPAAAAGIRPNDILTHIDGNRLRDDRHARSLVGGRRPGDRIVIAGIRRTGEPFEVEAVLTDQPPRTGS